MLVEFDQTWAKFGQRLAKLNHMPSMLADVLPMWATSRASLDFVGKPMTKLGPTLPTLAKVCLDRARSRLPEQVFDPSGNFWTNPEPCRVRRGNSSVPDFPIASRWH